MTIFIFGWTLPLSVYMSFIAFKSNVQNSMVINYEYIQWFL